MTNKKSQVEPVNGKIGVNAYDKGLDKNNMNYFYFLLIKITYKAPGTNKVTPDLAIDCDKSNTS